MFLWCDFVISLDIHTKLWVPLFLCDVTCTWCLGHDAKSMTITTSHHCSLLLSPYALVNTVQQAHVLQLASLETELWGDVPHCWVQHSPW